MNSPVKKVVLLGASLFLLLNLCALKEADAAAMTDYCVVPPYVIQDVPPNILMLVDNSGSMFNFAYACPTGFVQASANNVSVIPLDKVTGFKVGMKVQLMHAGAVQNTLWISAIDTVNNTITVTTLVSFVAGDFIQDYGCNNVVSLYDEPAATCTTLNIPNGYATITAVSPGLDVLTVSSDAPFVQGQYIVVNTVPPQLRYINLRGANKLTLNAPLTAAPAAGTRVYDATCFYFRTPEPERSFEPTRAYYGYFNDKYYYTYSSAGGKFLPNRPKSAGAKAADEWDGNFLNWLMMRRTDVLRRVLTGGRAVGGEGTGFDKLRTIEPDSTIRGVFKAVSNAENYVGCTNCTGNMSFEFGAGTADPAQFTAYTGDYQAGFTNRGTFSGDIRVPTPVEGVLQDLVGAKARVGLMFYRPNEGGFIQVSVGDTSVTPPKGLPATINQINLTAPSANTPVGEALWSATGYFAQQTSMEGGPGPRYASGDYNISANIDPFNYGTGGQARYPNCSKNFVLLVTDGEPCSDGNLPANVLNYTTGKSIFNCAGSACPATSGIAPETFSFPASNLPTCPAGNNLAGIEDVALYMHTKDLRADVSGKNNLTLYTVFAFGKNSTLLKYAAINGGFEDFDGSGKPDQQKKWDANGDGQPDTYYEADDGYELEQAMRNALSTMLKRAASGTAASVLASGEGSGANLVQAVFYPRRRFGNDIISWTGALQNLWYYVDPKFTSSSIREDTVKEVPDSILHLVNDYIAQLYFDPTLPGVKARRFQDTDGDGDPDVNQPEVVFENLGSIWEAARLLWSRDLSVRPRNIYANCSGVGGCIGSTGLMRFHTDNTAMLAPYLQLAGDAVRTQDVIRYMHGYDLTLDGLSFEYNPEPPLVTVDRNSDAIPDYRLRHAGMINPDTGIFETHIWKLGDILNSTPKIVSWLPLNDYFKVYGDKSYDNFTKTTSTSTPATNYQDRGMVFSGGNDGMLHAFKLGKLVLEWAGQDKKLQKAKLVNLDASNPLGHEEWAFIPKNALPYLKYFADPDYCHVYTVDLSPFIFDASIGDPGSGDISNAPKPDDGSTWRTILIGGMRYGGACRPTTGACNSTTGGLPDCVKTPVDIAGTSVGYSSYFALDITDTLAHPDDPVNYPPVLLWEFSDPRLGFAMTGPAVVKIVKDTTTNGNWFVVVGSGPTGPIDPANMQFLGRSDQNLRFFILDLKTGNLLRTIETGIPFAFAGSMINSTYDHKLANYADDAIYVGFVKKDAALGTWTQGGVGRILTMEDPNPANWRWGLVLDNIGAVSSAVTHLYNKSTKKLWLFFGTGRYYYEVGPSSDDGTSRRALYGVKDDSCVTADGDFDPNLCTPVAGVLTDRTTLPAACIADPANCPEPATGWYIWLDSAANGVTYCDAYDVNGTCVLTSTKNYWAERVITDPVASKTGGVFFTTYRPYNDECGLGGKSFIWALKADTGGSFAYALKGIALLQVSTGSIEQVDISKAFLPGAAGKDSRRTSAMEGVPPTSQGLALMSQPDPMKRIIHMKER